jgi:hypothetical protein
MNMTRFLALLALVIIFTSCENSASRKNTLPGKTGNPNEILLVAPDQVWKTSAGDVFKELMNKIQFGLPQDELMFQNIEVKESGFNDFWTTHRNIIRVIIDKSREEGVSVKREVYARQQLYTIVIIHDMDNLKKVLQPNIDQLLTLYYEEEIKRLIERNKYFGSEETNQQVEEIIDLDIIIQKDFFVAKQEDDFLWLRLEREKPLGGYQHQISQGLMIYWRPYTDTLDFSDSSLLAWKSDINRRFVEGPSNSVMTISDRMILPKTQLLTFNNQTAKEIRGLFRMEGYIMGGPFYSLAFYNPENGRQYMVEGFVYAPQFDKLKFVREIEAMVRSVKPVTKTEEK